MAPSEMALFLRSKMLEPVKKGSRDKWSLHVIVRSCYRVPQRAERLWDFLVDPFAATELSEKNDVLEAIEWISTPLRERWWRTVNVLRDVPRISLTESIIHWTGALKKEEISSLWTHITLSISISPPHDDERTHPSSFNCPFRIPDFLSLSLGDPKVSNSACPSFRNLYFTVFSKAWTIASMWPLYFEFLSCSRTLWVMMYPGWNAINVTLNMGPSMGGNKKGSTQMT